MFTSMKLGTIENISGIKLGILGTHLGVLEALVPNEEGLLPRDKDGEFVVVSGTKKLLELSPVRVDLIQLLSFGNTLPSEKDALIANLRELNIEPQLVMMVGGVDPMNPDDEDEAVAQLLHNIDAARRNQTTEINSTSIEPWMEGTPPSDENDFQERVTQNIKLHFRAAQEADLEKSCINN